MKIAYHEEQIRLNRKMMVTEDGARIATLWLEERD
jgi:hypothetical protein